MGNIFVTRPPTRRNVLSLGSDRLLGVGWLHMREEKCYASEARTIRVVKTESTYRVAWAGILSGDMDARLNTFHFVWESLLCRVRLVGGIVGKPLPATSPNGF